MGRGRGFTADVLRPFRVAGSGLIRVMMPDSSCFIRAYRVRFFQGYLVSFAEVDRGCRMDLHWARSNKFLLVVLAIAAALVGVLITLVLHQQHGQRVDGQVQLGTAPALPAGHVAAGADIMATSNGAIHPDAATTPDPANAPVGPASQPAPASPAPQVTPGAQVATTAIAPALVVPVPRIVTPAQLAQSPQTSLKPKTRPHRRVNAVPAPPPAAEAQPVIPAPQTATPVKPGSPDGW
jgi:hypothetical protein